jgi:hypothetical protein
MFGYSILPGKEDGHSVLVGSGKVRSGRITCVSQIMIQEYFAMRSLVFCSSCDRLCIFLCTMQYGQLKGFLGVVLTGW